MEQRRGRRAVLGHVRECNVGLLFDHVRAAGLCTTQLKRVGTFLMVSQNEELGPHQAATAASAAASHAVSITPRSTMNPLKCKKMGA